jgi:tetratricopeptide (TPR) repeat protein
MKNVCSVYVGMILFGLVASAAHPVAAQSQNSEARKWLQTGLTEKNASKKIAAYTKAFELDSLLVEAAYNLGLAYKKRLDYRLAEQWFGKAYNINSENVAPELRLQIALELARNYKRLGKLSACEEVLLRAKGVTVNGALRAEVLFELARFQFEQGRYEEALTGLREGEKLDRNKEDNFKSFIQLVESTMQSRRLTAAAQRAIASGELNQAQTLLAQIRSNNPEEENLADLTLAVDSLREAETNRKMLAVMYGQAQKEAAGGNLEAAIGVYESLLQKAGDYQDAKDKLEAARQQLAQNQILTQLEQDYEAGVSALRAGDWPLAILSFEKVLSVDENFHDTKKRLEEANRALEKESTETIIARYYAEGVSAMKRDDLGGALAAFEKLRQLNPGYRDAGDLLIEVEQRLANKAKPDANPVDDTARAEALYSEALAAVNHKDWMQAVVALEKLQLVHPDYRDVANRLVEARTNLYAAAADNSEVSWLYIGGALVAIITFPLAGFMAFSPAPRARLHLLRGNYFAAAQIYEKILMRHPGRVKLYPLLANIYLHLGRHDDQALKIYKAVLQLNIATPKRDEINTIVAQNYLTEGRTDSDAIEVLEHALKVERLKQNHGSY